MPSISDYELPNGFTDWKAYEAAKVANGDSCWLCGGYIMFGGKGYRQSCGDCRRLGGNDATSHEKLLRCPACRHHFAVNWEMHQVFSDGEHEVYCPSCEHKFEIVTRVSFSFRSPEILKVEHEPPESA